MDRLLRRKRRLPRLTAGFVAALVGLLVGLSGCESTPEERIRKDPDAFEYLSDREKAGVQRGEIDIGYSRDAVRLAKGRPTRVLKRTAAGAGDSEVWVYSREDTGQRAGVTFGVGGSGGDVGVGVGVGTGFGHAGGYETYDYLRVIFEQGRVSAIERAR